MSSQAPTVTAFDGTANGSANGAATERWCAQCDKHVPVDGNGKCEVCGGFVKGNVGGRVLAQRRRKAGQELMDAIRQELIEDAGGEASLTGAERLLIEQAVRLEVLGRTLAGDVVRKGPGTEGGRQSLHAWLACLDRQARALNLLGTDRRAEAVDPYEVIEAAVKEANQDDQDDEDANESRPTDNGGAPTPDPDEIATHAAAQDPNNGDSPANGTGVMGAILQATEVRA